MLLHSCTSRRNQELDAEDYEVIVSKEDDSEEPEYQLADIFRVMRVK